MEVATILIRSFNLILWLIVATKVLLPGGVALSMLARRMVATVLMFGMAVFVVGALVPFGFPGPLATLVYTAFTAYASMIALAMLTTGEPNGEDE